MKVISKYQDYYDYMASFGVDPNHVFVRKNNDVFEVLEKGQSPQFMETLNDIHMVNQIQRPKAPFQIGALFFCGQVYTYIRVEREKTVFCYTKEQLQNAWPDNNNKIRLLHSHQRIALEDLIEHFNFQLNQRSCIDILNGWSQHYKIAYFDFITNDDLRSYDHSSFKKQLQIETHPVLKDYQFSKLKDGATAFQEIDQYLFGALNLAENETVTVTDEDMAKAKGHDGVYSFKKPPKKHN